MTRGAVHHSDPYSMSAQERSKYESLFPMYDSDQDGFVTGSEAVNLFSKSGLPREVKFCRILVGNGCTCKVPRFGSSRYFNIPSGARSSITSH